MSTRPRLRAALALAATAVLVVGTAGCSAPDEAVSNAHTLTVPALWAGTDADGRATGGIEPATITVATVGAPGFGLSLADDEARSAGPQWLAASASAASLATLLSGVDPRFVDIDYAVTGPIDGPSAGAILAVGTLAALTGRALDDGVTMTGTISPNGAIGPVAGIATKMHAAATAGFTRVLVPMTNLSEATAAGADIDVVGVRTIDDAFAAFTGQDAVEPPPVAPAVTPAVGAVIAERATAMVAAASTDVIGLPDDIDPVAAQRARALLTEAEAALAAGDETAAYGLGLGARLTAGQAVATANASTATADATIATTTEQIHVASRTPATNVGQQAALASVVAASAAVRATTEGVAQTEPASAEERAAVASILAEQALLSDAVWADDLAVVAAMSDANDAALLGEEAARFASGYTDFLVRAARANRDYAEQVLKTATDDTALDTFGLLVAAGKALRDLDAVQPHTQPLADEVEQIGLAIAAYVLSGELVDALQRDGSTTGATGTALTAMTRDFLGWATDRGVDVGYPLWQTSWARSLDGSGLADGHVKRVADQATSFALITSAMLDAAWSRAPG